MFGSLLILSSYALQALPVDWFGAALVLLAFALFVLDLVVTNHGGPAIAGMVALVLGGLMLFGATAYSWASLVTFVAVAILGGVLFIVALREALAAKGRPATTGVEGMIGEVGIVRTPVGASFPGWVFVRGELWQAVAAVAPEDAHKDHEQAIGIGRRVQVVNLRDGKVVVLPFESAEPEHLPES